MDKNYLINKIYKKSINKKIKLDKSKVVKLWESQACLLFAVKIFGGSYE